MKRLFVLSIGGALALCTAGPMIVNAQQPQGVILISDQPVTEEQVRAKLQADGWSNLQIVREGRYFRITAAKAGQAEKFSIDGQTGRLRDDDDDDDD
jgi:hypothetical protein